MCEARWIFRAHLRALLMLNLITALFSTYYAVCSGQNSPANTRWIVIWPDLVLSIERQVVEVRAIPSLSSSRSDWVSSQGNVSTCRLGSFFALLAVRNWLSNIVLLRATLNQPSIRLSKMKWKHLKIRDLQKIKIYTIILSCISYYIIPADIRILACFRVVFNVRW